MLPPKIAGKRPVKNWEMGPMRSCWWRSMSGGTVAGAGWKNPAASGWPGRARRIVRGRLGDLALQRVEIEHLRVGVDRRDAELISLRLHVGQRVVALLHLHERIADAR